MKSGYSLRWRLLLAAALVLLLFMGLTGWALDSAYQHSARQALQDRLEARLYALMAVAELDQRGALKMPVSLQDERFNLPGSGLYAQILDGKNQVGWQSRSLLFDIPAAMDAQLGKFFFNTVEIS